MNSAGGVSWSELHSESDLFSWFQLVELGRRVDGNLTWITLAPEAVADSVRLRFALDEGEQVLAFQLAIDRAWLDGETTAMANAGDLAKSVVECFAQVDPLLSQVSSDLQAGSFGASSSPVFVRGAPPQQTGRPDIAAVVAVLTSADAPPAEVHAEQLVYGANIQTVERVWFVLSWGSSPVPPERW